MKQITLRACLHTLVFALLVAGEAGYAERQSVLRQIAVPHDYYFREMYLPQVSAGPQSPAWSPDGHALVFTMQGSLWRQDIDSTTATQLTAGPGYDHHPDWSPDGRRIVFARYHDDALELHVLDIASGAVTQMTAAGNVNLEPRWSPDGSKIAFVSTAGTGQFHVFVGNLDDGLDKATRVTNDRRSGVERYYYSEFDHELSPVWSPDGAALLYVSNPEVPYGTGDLWYHSLVPDAVPLMVRREETTWRARPDIAPDGRRVVYSSYLGRQWHQLWLTTVEGEAEPFPLTYGDFDATFARWSPDGERIAYTTNENGNTELRVIRIPGGQVTRIEVEERRYLGAMGSIRLATVNDDGEKIPARVSVVAEDGRVYAPHDAWMHADDGFDRSQRSEEVRYFHIQDEVIVEVPAGKVTITAWHGMERHIGRQVIDVAAGKTTSMELELRRLDLAADWSNWRSADVHVHMNYGGIYRNTPEIMRRQAEAEDLDVVFNLIVNKEQRVPDIRYFAGTADKASNSGVVIQHSQEFHTGYWGHVGLLGLRENLLWPDYSAYPGTAAASLFPDNVAVADMAREQGAVMGYVHTFGFPLPDPATDASLTNALPIDVALGKVDYYEIVGFAEHRAAAQVWYRLLNCGFRVSAAGGTDAMANFASLRGPVGMNRTYVYSDFWPDDPDALRDTWIDALRSGKSLATNAPLLGLSVNGAGPGETLSFAGPTTVQYRGFLRSAVPLDALELVFNGEVIREIELGPDGMTANFDGSVEVQSSGWLLLRASAAGPHPDVFDMYPYGTTNAVFVEIAGQEPRSREDAEYFLAWIERVRESAAAHPDYFSERERQRVLAHIDEAAAVFEERRTSAP